MADASPADTVPDMPRLRRQPPPPRPTHRLVRAAALSGLLLAATCGCESTGTLAGVDPDAGVGVQALHQARSLAGTQAATDLDTALRQQALTRGSGLPTAADLPAALATLTGVQAQFVATATVQVYSDGSTTCLHLDPAGGPGTTTPGHCG